LLPKNPKTPFNQKQNIIENNLIKINDNAKNATFTLVFQLGHLDGQ